MRRDIQLELGYLCITKSRDSVVLRQPFGSGDAENKFHRGRVKHLNSLSSSFKDAFRGSVAASRGFLGVLSSAPSCPRTAF